MVDFSLNEQDSWVEFDIASGLDTALLYVYQGSLTQVNDVSHEVPSQSVILFDADNDNERSIRMKAFTKDTGVLLFAGRKLKEPIAWHGPIVMNTQQEVAETFKDIRAGNFPPVRVDWDYRRQSAQSASGMTDEL
jgi:redox-sensitive bicupin YhaK (pirin superfamily)